MVTHIQKLSEIFLNFVESSVTVQLVRKRIKLFKFSYHRIPLLDGNAIELISRTFYIICIIHYFLINIFFILNYT